MGRQYAGPFIEIDGMKYFYLLLLLPASGLCQSQLVDTDADRRTRSLYTYLANIPDDQFLFGHQDDLLYGVGWSDVEGGSDVRALIGKYPAVFGWDIGGLGAEYNLDSVHFDRIIEGIKKAYKMGGINTISWHAYHPVSNQNSWNKDEGIRSLLPGNSGHEAYTERLDELAKFIKRCKVGLRPVPIIFRPFHEHNGDWFWWGKGINTEEEYIQLWRFTHDYLTQQIGLHNLIFAFSPDRSRMNLEEGWESYAYAYPGNDYVDILGLDNYWDAGLASNEAPQELQLQNFQRSLVLLRSYGEEQQKIIALTETGNDRLEIENWYTERLLAPIISEAMGLAWVLVWRNANENHHYVPSNAPAQADDFRLFEEHESTIFQDELNSK